MPILETLGLIGALLAGTSAAGNAAYNIWGPDEEPPRPNAPYRPSRFLPDFTGGGQNRQMQGYAPQNRQMRSGPSPEIMAYLRKFIRPQY